MRIVVRAREERKRERETMAKEEMRTSFVLLHKRDESEHIVSQLDRISCAYVCTKVFNEEKWIFTTTIVINWKQNYQQICQIHVIHYY